MSNEDAWFLFEDKRKIEEVLPFVVTSIMSEKIPIQGHNPERRAINSGTASKTLPPFVYTVSIS